jgi:hypothetical protein
MAINVKEGHTHKKPRLAPSATSSKFNTGAELRQALKTADVDQLVKGQFTCVEFDEIHMF